MFPAYIIFTLVLCMFIAFAWSSNGFANICIKMAFTINSVWTGLILLGYIWQQVEHGHMRLF